MNQPNPVRVIVTDDHTLFRTGVKNSLESRNDILVIGEAENGKQLLELLETLRPDLVTLNLQMPVMNGFDTLPLLRERYPQLKVLMISMHNDPEAIRKAYELGANGYLNKEAGSEDIYEAIIFLTRNWIYINRMVAEAMIRSENKRNPALPPKLTEKDQHFLNLLCAGHTEDHIGKILELRPVLVEAFVQKLIRLHKVDTKEELILLNL